MLLPESGGCSSRKERSVGYVRSREEGAPEHMRRPFVGEILREIAPPRITGVDPASSTATFRNQPSFEVFKRDVMMRSRGKSDQRRDVSEEEGRDLGNIWCG